MEALGNALGAVLEICGRVTGQYGWAILLFTLLSRILLLPLSIWVHLNGMKVVRMQPEINRLQIRCYGDRDRIAEGQAALYKREKYNPLIGLIPLAVQIVILAGVIQAIRAQASDAVFAGLQLNLTATETGGRYWLLPVLAGGSALLMALAQNRLNPLQKMQGGGMKAATNLLSVGLSLYLGAFVPAGVALYWIAGNLLTIGQQLLLNRLFPPEKYTDAAALAETEAELEKLRSLDRTGEAGDRRRQRELRRREKADEKRFFSVANKHLVFYSESNGFYKYLGPVIAEILERSNVTVHYITSDPEDGIFERARGQERLKAYYIGPRRLITVFMRMDADVVVMTMSDLDNYHYKRSYVRQDIRYIYLFHYPLSTHMVLHTGALDHYDEILCVGDFQIPEIRRQEELAGLPPKRLEVCGYCQLDSLYRDWQGMAREKGDRPEILIAPSWQEDNLLDSCLDPLLKGLLGRGWRVTVRPHPEYMKRYRPRMEEIQRRWADYAGGDLFFETDFSSSRSIYASDLVITDWSGTATEFAFVTLRPCLFVDTPPKINNPRYTELGIEPQELILRDQIGKRISPEEAERAGDRAEELLREPEAWQERIAAVRDRLIANFPDSAPHSARAILAAVVEQQSKRGGKEK